MNHRSSSQKKGLTFGIVEKNLLVSFLHRSECIPLSLTRGPSVHSQRKFVRDSCEREVVLGAVVVLPRAGKTKRNLKLLCFLFFHDTVQRIAACAITHPVCFQSSLSSRGWIFGNKNSINNHDNSLNIKQQPITTTQHPTTRTTNERQHTNTSTNFDLNNSTSHSHPCCSRPWCTRS